MASRARKRFFKFFNAVQRGIGADGDRDRLKPMPSP
jgi:hypothetical protein